jgi:hypothetical protein
MEVVPWIAVIRTSDATTAAPLAHSCSQLTEPFLKNGQA